MSHAARRLWRRIAIHRHIAAQRSLAAHSRRRWTRGRISARPPRGGIALALLALGAQGCISGHLLDAARRRERPVAYHDASIDGGHLLLAYSALVTDDLGRHPERTERRVALALTDLRRGDLAVEAFPVARLAADAPLGGEPVALHPGTDGRSAGPPPFLEIDVGPEGQHVRFVLHDTRGVPYPPFYSAALTRTRTVPWVYPLLPLSLAVDAATNPVLLFFAPAVMVLGD